MIYSNQLQYFKTNEHQWIFYAIGGLCEIAVMF